MRRLPSEPKYLMEKRLQRNAYKILKRRTIIALIEIAIIFLFLIFLFFKSSPLIENFKYRTNGLDCEIKCIDYLYGKGVYFECGNENALIDSGTDEHFDELINFIESEEIEKLDYLLISELNPEYTKTLDQLIDHVKIGRIIIPENEESLPAGYEDILLNCDSSFFFADKMPYFAIHKLKFQIVDKNSMSCNVVFGENSFLIFNYNDDNTAVETIKSKPYINPDVLISLKGNLPSDLFFETVTPDIFVLNGKSDVDISSAEKFANEIYRTDINGNIAIKSNEIDIKIECEKQ